MISEMYYVANKNKLPLEGDSIYLYSTTCMTSQWRWRDEAKDYTRVFKKTAKELVDPTATMPSIGMAKLKKGGDIRLALYYNIISLRLDLEQQSQLNLNRNTLSDFYERTESKLNNDTSWFKNTHVLLFKMLNQITNNKNSVVSRNMMDGLNDWNCDLWFEKDHGHWLFKCDGLLVVI